jgi:hypothetical protein
VSPVKYELGFYIPEDDILHCHRRENLKSYTVFVSMYFKGMSFVVYFNAMCLQKLDKSR